MKNTYRQLFMSLLAMMLCLSLPSCSDDDDEKQTNEVTLNWEIEVNDDLLNVANVTCTLFEGEEQVSESEIITAKSSGSKVTGKAPCTLGVYIGFSPKVMPDTQKESYDLSISVKVSLTNPKGEAVAAGFSMDKQLKGVPADRIDNSLRTIQKLLDSAQSICRVDASGRVETISPMPEPEKVSDLQALQKALFYTDEEGKQQLMLGKALDAARPDVLSVRVNDLDDAKATFLRWMPDAGQALATGNNLTWTLKDEKESTMGNAYFTATDGTGGQVAKITFDAAVQPQGISQINFLLSSAWPLNSELKHRMGDKKRAKATAYRKDAIWPDGEVDCYCINNAYEDELAYYVGFGLESRFPTNLDDGIMQRNFSLLASEQTAKGVQDILNKPAEKGGLGWDYYQKWFLEKSGKDIDCYRGHAWIDRWRRQDKWYESSYYCYEIDLDNGYQDYELAEHGIPMIMTQYWMMHVVVYKGDKLIDGWEIE